MSKINRKSLIQYLRTAGMLSAKEICAHFSASQPTANLALSASRREILKIGKGSRTRYAARREVSGLGDTWNIFRVGSTGTPQSFAKLYAIFGEDAREEFAVVFEKNVPETLVKALCGDEFRDGIFPDLPWFLLDHRPQGFIGRGIAATLVPLNFSPKIENWRSETILRYWLGFGDDIAGSLIIGDAMREKFLSAGASGTHQIIPKNERATAYPANATQAQNSVSVFSSAAGEQPKFIATVTDAQKSVRSCIVKFSGEISTAVGRREADLLVAEKIASDILADAGFPVPHTEIIFAKNRCFLESARIDRVGERGRVFTFSLNAIDAAFIGSEATSWADSVGRGVEFGLFSDETLARVRELQDFGNAIGNTDMHFGNLSFKLHNDALPFALAPVYDMNPAIYAPRRNETELFSDALAVIPASNRAQELAARFWEKVSTDARISENFRQIATQNFSKTNTRTFS